MVSFSLGLGKFARCPFPSADFWGFTLFGIFKYSVSLHRKKMCQGLNPFLLPNFLAPYGNLPTSHHGACSLGAAHTMVWGRLVLCHEEKKSCCTFSSKNVGTYVPCNTEMKLESFFPAKIIVQHLLRNLDTHNIEIDGLATFQWKLCS